MKTLRNLAFCFFILIGALSLSGCATTQHGSFAQQMRLGMDKETWDELTWSQKTSAYLLGYVQAVIYGMGAQEASFHP